MRSIKVILSFFLLLALLPVPVLAGELEGGLNAYDGGNYEAAYRLLKPLAEQGASEAQSVLGIMYANGQGVKRNDIEAGKWFRKAAEQGHALAQNNLGAMYWKGVGVPKNDSEAFKWISKAAEQGYADAQYVLGNMYGYGWGGGRHNRKALGWWHKAAEQGDARAQHNLGVNYFGSDPEEAAKWFLKAAEQGDAGSQYNLGLMYLNGTGVEENSNQAIYWFNQAIESDNANPRFYNALGSVFSKRGQYNRAVIQFDKALMIDPENDLAYRLKAWLLATCPEEEYRDGDEAVELAKKALSKSVSSRNMDVLAAAYAESEMFEDAVTAQEEAMKMVKKRESNW